MTGRFLLVVLLISTLPLASSYQLCRSGDPANCLTSSYSTFTVGGATVTAGVESAGVSGTSMHLQAPTGGNGTRLSPGDPGRLVFVVAGAGTPLNVSLRVQAMVHGVEWSGPVAATVAVGANATGGHTFGFRVAGAATPGLVLIPLGAAANNESVTEVLAFEVPGGQPTPTTGGPDKPPPVGGYFLAFLLGVLLAALGFVLRERTRQ